MELDRDTFKIGQFLNRTYFVMEREFEHGDFGVCCNFRKMLKIIFVLGLKNS